MTHQNLRTLHRTTGASVTLAALAVLGVYACSDVSHTPDDNSGGSGGSAGAPAAGSGGSGGVAGSTGGAGGSAGAGSAGTGGSSATGGSAGSGSGTGSGGSSSGAAGSSAGSSGVAGSSSDAGVGDPDAALADGGEQPIENLISNSDFESGILPWTAAFGGVLSVTTEQAHGGLQSAKVTGRTADYQGAHFDVTDFVTPGSSYTLTAFARIAGASPTASVKTTARIKCATLTDEYRPIRNLTANDSSWTELTGTLAVPSCTLIELLVYVEGPPAAYDLYVDDVSMFPL